MLVKVTLPEIVRHGIQMPGPAGRRQRDMKPLVTLKHHNIDYDDPLFKLFRLLGPDDNPLGKGDQNITVLVANKKADLEQYAQDCWDHMDIFGGSSNLIRALKAVAEVHVPETVKGNFSRLKAALKIMLPEHDTKVRRQIDLSTLLEQLTEDVRNGKTKEPEISHAMRYDIIRATSKLSEVSPVVFKHQFTGSMTPIQAYVLDETNGVHKEVLAYIPNHQTGHKLRYKTIALNKNNPNVYGSSAQSVLARLLSFEDRGQILEISAGGESKSSSEVMRLDEIEDALEAANIPAQLITPKKDGTNNTKLRDKLHVKLSDLCDQACLVSPFIYDKLSPKVSEQSRSGSVWVSNISSRSKNSMPLGPSRWAAMSLVTTANMQIDFGTAATPQIDYVSSIFGVDTTFITKRTDKFTKLSGKMGDLWNASEKILEEEFGHLFKPGISMIRNDDFESARNSDTVPKSTFDCLIPGLGRSSYAPYATTDKAMGFWGKHGSQEKLNKLYGNLAQERWTTPWNGLRRVFFKSKKISASVRHNYFSFLPPQQLVTSYNQRSARWKYPVAPISPLLGVFIAWTDRMIQNGTIRPPACDCGDVNSHSDWDSLAHLGSPSEACDLCDTFKGLLLQILSAFVVSRTVRGSYFEWWKPGNGQLDMHMLVSNLVGGEEGISQNLPKRLHLVYPVGAIIDYPDLERYRGQGGTNSKGPPDEIVQ